MVFFCMKEADLARLQKIKTHCVNIQRTIRDLTVDHFKSVNGIDAREVCAFRLFQIGEHSHKLSDELKTQYPDFAWGAAYRFRNVLGHDYDGISSNAIWRSCKNDIPVLLSYVERIIAETQED